MVNKAFDILGLIKACLGKAKKKPYYIELRRRFDEGLHRGDDAPGDHDAAYPSACAPALDDKPAWDLKQDVTEKKERISKSEDLVVEARQRANHGHARMHKDRARCVIMSHRAKGRSSIPSAAATKEQQHRKSNHPPVGLCFACSQANYGTGTAAVIARSRVACGSGVIDTCARVSAHRVD